MTTATAATDELGALLALQQLLSPAFPTGGFAYSHGLEAAMQAGELASIADLEEWVTGILVHGGGWSDAVILANALATDADLEELALTARALAANSERWRETIEQGEALARGATAIGLPACPAPLPVALAGALRPLGLPPALVVAAYLQAFASNLILIAVRHAPLSPAAGQALLAALRPRIAALAERATQTAVCDIWTCALRADLMALRHEALEVRLFRT